MSSTLPIPDQTGRLAVITGANSGIGFEAARVLALAGADLVLATRNADKGELAAAQIRRAAPNVQITREALDLSSLASVADFVHGRHAAGRPIDLLINNAGIMALPTRKLTSQTAAEGALPGILAATGPDVQSGVYFGPNGNFGLVGAPTRIQVPGRARSAHTASALWTISTELTHVHWPAAVSAPAVAA